MGFIENTALQIWKQYNEQVSEHLFLFPSRRSMLYFKRAITEAAGQNIWVPECLTLEQWILDQSDVILADPITAAYELYLSARQVGFTADSFELFYPLAQVIINDFEQIDLELIDPDQIWEHASAWQYISTQEQHTSIWQEMKDTALKEKWIVNWNKLHSLYTRFMSTLRHQNLTTKGHAYREIVQNLANHHFNDFTHIHVIGFSSLTKAEVGILEFLRSGAQVEFYWNISPLLTAPGLDAGKKVVTWAEHFGQNLDLTMIDFQSPDTQIINTSGMVPQIKTISQILEASKDKAEKTAVLLPHPVLIDLFLKSFPDSLDKVNISLGYPLIYSPARTLVEWILTLWEKMEEERIMHRTDLDLIWSHLYISNYIRTLNLSLPDTRQLYFTSDDLMASHKELAEIYAPLGTPAEALDRLIHIIDRLINVQPDVFHREVLRYMKGRLIRLNDVLSPIAADVSFIFLKRIVYEMMQGASVPFRGEPMEGIQVLGVQEVQNLTFDTLIIPGMNEEILPSGKLKSMIPYSLRKLYGLESVSDLHATQSYYIWSAIAQAKKVDLLYSQNDDLLGAKGISRYIYQLKHGGVNIPYHEKFLDLDLSGFEAGSKEILLTHDYETRLHDYLQNKGLSPTALMSYISCSFQFFLRYILRIREDDTPRAGLDFSDMGSVIHDIMNELYKPYQNKNITVSDFKKIEEQIETLTEDQYQELYPQDRPDSLKIGIHWIEKEIIIRAVRKFIAYDRKLKGLTIEKLEATLENSVSTEKIKNVRLTGKIDRLDRINNRYRIIDYKTGQSKLVDKPLAKLLEERNPSHNWQVLFYAFLLREDLKSASFEVGHYTLKDRKMYVPLMSKRQAIHHETDLDTFEEVLIQIIDEMVDPQVPFTQTENTSRCTYCAFNIFCERQGE
ncbi:PD-(D/E)XK nuclease family protein [Membranicola marinus]|uniref:PD-(D/E)XK nuclease family protein n=1 Tax=Membranihabitans marinus TaxID=1227546 RepID=A0A953HVC4_9BACT|nr:PD-(D/E)XK nuclease family protein [Membranihabitans marinus]MBY5957211.1 PD-(D/E)XK nuclease family protein [Membranihabitans marinus]